MKKAFFPQAFIKVVVSTQKIPLFLPTKKSESNRNDKEGSIFKTTIIIARRHSKN